MASGTNLVRPAASSSSNDPLTALLPFHPTYSISLCQRIILACSTLITTSGQKKKQTVSSPAYFMAERWSRSRISSPIQMSFSAGRPLTAGSVLLTLPLPRFNCHATGCCRTPSSIHPSCLNCPRTRKQSCDYSSRLAEFTRTTSSATIEPLNGYAWRAANYSNNVTRSRNFGSRNITPPGMPLPTAGKA